MRYTQGALLQPGAGIGGFLRTAGTFLKRFILPAAKKAITSKAGKQSMKAIAKGAKEVLTNVVSGDTGENKKIVHKVKKQVVSALKKGVVEAASKKKPPSVKKKKRGKQKKKSSFFD